MLPLLYEKRTEAYTSVLLNTIMSVFLQVSVFPLQILGQRFLDDLGNIAPYH